MNTPLQLRRASAHQPHATALAFVKAAVDDGDRTGRVDGELVHQPALKAAIEAVRIGAPRHDRGSRKAVTRVSGHHIANTSRSFAAVGKKLQCDIDQSDAINREAR